MELKLTKPNKSFDVEVEGVSFGRFEVESEWEGMIKLIGASSSSVIIASEGDEGNNLFDKLLSLHGADPCKGYQVLKMTPNLVEKVKSANARKQ